MDTSRIRRLVHVINNNEGRGQDITHKYIMFSYVFIHHLLSS